MTTNNDKGMRYTPGPWRRHDTELSTIVQAKTGIAIADCFARSRSVEENTSNVRLIATAPELLEALRDIVNEAIEHWPDAESWRFILVAQELIAKAQGGAIHHD